jgi:hypothetical protein
MIRLGLAVVASLLATSAEPTDARRVFDVADRPAREGVVVASWASRPSEVPESAMLRQLLGVRGVLGPADLGTLRRAVDSRARVPERVDHRIPIATLYLTAGDDNAVVELERVDQGWVLARQAETGASARLLGRGLDDLLARWVPARPDPAAPVGDAARVQQLPDPLTPSPQMLTEPEVSRRFSGGGEPIFPEPLSRDLGSEAFHARLPAGHRPDRPAGLLVWINADAQGVLPDVLFQAADSMGLICIAAENAGNERPAVDRLQLALDAVESASARWWVDPTRVYVAGISGGARVASMLWDCFPDVFAGGVGVVGLNSHHAAPIGDGRAWPRTHTRPGGELGRSGRDHRFAVISGPRDMNFKEIRARTNLLRREGFAVRLFDHADQGHELCTPERFAAALSWVDEPHAARFAELTDTGRRTLDAAIARFGEGPPRDDQARRMLERVTIVAPWTEPAWTAAAWLGYAPAAAP